MTTREPAAGWDEEAAEEFHLLRAAEDAALEPWALLKAVRDPSGRVVDFVYRDLNRIAAQQQQQPREDLLGRSVAESLPDVVRSGILDSYIRCIDTGEPLVLDDLSFFGRTLDGIEEEARRYDMRGVRVGTEYLSLNWRDVDDRSVATGLLAESEHRYRLLAEQLDSARLLLEASADSMLDPQVLLEAVRDPAGQVIDFRYLTVNAAACSYLGLQESDLVGHTQLEASPNLEGSELQRRYIQCLEDGQPVFIDDYSFFNEIIDDDRRYDIRAARAGDDMISLTWSDVTERFAADQRVKAASALLRATADSMLNPQMLLEAVRDPDGRVVDFTYRSVNRAACSYRRLDEQDMLGKSALEIQPGLVASGLLGRYADCVDTGVPVILDGFSFANAVHDDDRRYDIRATRAGVDLISLTYGDVSDRFHAAARIAASERDYRLLAENAGDLVVLIRDGRFVWVSPSCTDVIGASPDYWVGREATEIVLPEEGERIAESTEVVESGGVVQMRHRVQALDGTIHWVDVRAKPFHAPDGREDGITAAMRVIDDEVAAEEKIEKARAAQAKADALYRRSVESAAVGMCLASPEGSFLQVNNALCEFFGYDAATLLQKTWIELTAPDYLQADLDRVTELVAGSIESYRMVKQFIHADGHLLWGDLSVGCLRRADGSIEYSIGQIADITAEVQARERLVASEERNRELAEGIQAELGSAAKYLRSVLPGDMVGQVSVTTRYLPSQTLGGDCFDYHWIDDDHMVIYLLDVSGHGVESALIAVSVHNMLRSATFTTEIMLEPDQVLATLNQQFAMDHHDGNYFTIFFGVYQRSTATLRYASAGHPPALICTGGHLAQLDSQSLPLGMFDDTTFTTTTLPMPAGSRMLLYSDGVYELTLDNGGQWPLESFINSCAQLCSSPEWTLDDVIDTALGHSASGDFEDDCSLIKVMVN